VLYGHEHALVNNDHLAQGESSQMLIIR